PEVEGLCINPVIPAEWDGFEVSRTFRGTTYQIRVDNSAHVQQGIKKAQMDGQELPVTPDGRVILPDCSGDTAQVDITLG
ncbi:MAG: hypothetical protein IJJ17_07280, partial [Parasporobacterium sp.]|nr:hypothetical protein [Parasporobacterium sp.]